MMLIITTLSSKYLKIVMLLASLSSISVSEMPLLDFFRRESQYLASSSGLLLDVFGSL